MTVRPFVLPATLAISGMALLAFDIASRKNLCDRPEVINPANFEECTGGRIVKYFKGYKLFFDRAPAGH